ncbi:MAG: nucleotidyl transferase AbiEii/AbiGii toxin family protein [Pseudobdellovibrionaceae bacterium]
MNLHENPSDFQDAINATSKDLGIREVYIEKDYWVSYVLWKLSLSTHSKYFVFKGGTSLSKAHKIIYRFSEDIDLSVLASNMTDAKIKSLISKVANEITGDALPEKKVAGLTNKFGTSRATVHSYPSIVASKNFESVSDQIFIEINSFTEPAPNQKVRIKSMIGEFLEKRNNTQLVKEFNLRSFEVQVLDLRVTFIEKILALCYASFEDGKSLGEKTRKVVRHFYDLTAMQTSPDLKKFPSDSKMKEMITKIRKSERLESRTKWADRKLIECHLFENIENSLKSIESYYKTELAPLVFRKSDMISFNEVKKTFKKIQKFLIEHNL